MGYFWSASDLKNNLKDDLVFRYENRDPLIRFTEAQLAEIRKATVAKLVCENSDGIIITQRSAFDQHEPFLYESYFSLSISAR